MFLEFPEFNGILRCVAFLLPAYYFDDDDGITVDVVAAADDEDDDYDNTVADAAAPTMITVVLLLLLMLVLLLVMMMMMMMMIMVVVVVMRLCGLSIGRGQFMGCRLLVGFDMRYLACTDHIVPGVPGVQRDTEVRCFFAPRLLP